MKKIINLFSAALLCIACTNMASASSHREAPLISTDPLADNTDLYAFRSPCDTSKVVIVANYIPFEHPAGGPNYYTFGEDIRYEIHIDNDASKPGDDIIFRFTFKHVNEDPTTFFNIRLGKQNIKTTYTMEASWNGGQTFGALIKDGVVPPPNIGPRSIENSTVGLGKSYEQLMTEAVKTVGFGGKVFCGPVDDPFFVDLGGVFDVGNFRTTGRDAVAKFNCHSIVMEIPIAILQKDHKKVSQASSILDPEFIIGVYASASRRKVTTLDSTGGKPVASDKWIQVSRLGMPLTNEAVIPIGSKDRWNATSPANDLQFAPFFNNPELALYMDDSQFGGAVPGLAQLRVQSKSLGTYDFRNGHEGLYPLKGSAAVAGTALDDALFGTILLPDNHSPRAVDLLPIFYTGVPNLAPYQLATGKPAGNPLAPGKPFINNFLPTLGDYLRLNMAVPVTPRNDKDFSSLGIVQAAVLGLTDPRFNTNASMQFIPNMDGFPNGRRLEDDVTSIELQAVGGVALAAIGLWYDDYVVGGDPVTQQLLNTITFQAGVTHNDTTFKPCFPYVQTPWRGFTGAEYVGPKSTIFPVSWLSFGAVKTADQKVQLTWKVASEINSAHYDVEYSIVGSKDFKKIATVLSKSGSSTNTYQYLHAFPSKENVNYYRIKQVDKDGKYSYSPVIPVKIMEPQLITVSPNPFVNSIKVFGNQPALEVRVYNNQGAVLATRQAIKGFAEINTSSFARGMYTVVAYSNGVKVDSKKIIKQ